MLAHFMKHTTFDFSRLGICSFSFRVHLILWAVRVLIIFCLTEMPAIFGHFQWCLKLNTAQYASNRNILRFFFARTFFLFALNIQYNSMCLTFYTLCSKPREFCPKFTLFGAFGEKAIQSGFWWKRNVTTVRITINIFVLSFEKWIRAKAMKFIFSMAFIRMAIKSSIRNS